MVNRIPSRLWVKSTLGLIAGVPGGDGTPLFLHKTIPTWEYQKHRTERRKENGERGTGDPHRADGGGCGCEVGVMELADLILRAMIEALKLDGKVAVAAEEAK